MKHILCFGDSNTHGYIPGGGRYDESTRWTGLLARNLGRNYCIHEEGLNGRTTSLEDPYEPYRNAMDYIIPCLKTHEPLDLTIVMLGSNDMKRHFQPTAEKIAVALRKLVRIILDVSQAPVLLVSPILLGDKISDSLFGDSFPRSSVSISHQLGPALAAVAKDLDVHFLDAATVADPSDRDGLHLEAEGHYKLAEAFTEKVFEILEPKSPFEPTSGIRRLP